MTKRKRYILLSVLVLVCAIVALAWPFLRILRGFVPSAKLVRQVVNVSALPGYRPRYAQSLGGAGLGVMICDETSGKLIFIMKTITDLDELGIDPADWPSYPSSLEETWELLSGPASESFSDFQESSREVLTAHGHEFLVLRGTHAVEGQPNILCQSRLDVVSDSQGLTFQINLMSEKDDFTTDEIRQVLDALIIN